MTKVIEKKVASTFEKINSSTDGIVNKNEPVVKTDNTVKSQEESMEEEIAQIKAAKVANGSGKIVPKSVEPKKIVDEAEANRIANEKYEKPFLDYGFTKDKNGVLVLIQDNYSINVTMETKQIVVMKDTVEILEASLVEDADDMIIKNEAELPDAIRFFVCGLINSFGKEIINIEKMEEAKRIADEAVKTTPLDVFKNTLIAAMFVQDNVNPFLLLKNYGTVIPENELELCVSFDTETHFMTAFFGNEMVIEEDLKNLFVDSAKMMDAAMSNIVFNACMEKILQETSKVASKKVVEKETIEEPTLFKIEKCLKLANNYRHLSCGRFFKNGVTPEAIAKFYLEFKLSGESCTENDVELLRLLDIYCN